MKSYTLVAGWCIAPPSYPAQKWLWQLNPDSNRSVTGGIDVSAALMRFFLRGEMQSYICWHQGRQDECMCVCVFLLVIMLMTYLPIAGNGTTGRSQPANILALDCHWYYRLSAEPWQTPWCEELHPGVVNDALREEVRTRAREELNVHFIFTVRGGQTVLLLFIQLALTVCETTFSFTYQRAEGAELQVSFMYCIHMFL